VMLENTRHSRPQQYVHLARRGHIRPLLLLWYVSNAASVAFKSTQGQVHVPLVRRVSSVPRLVLRQLLAPAAQAPTRVLDFQPVPFAWLECMLPRRQVFHVQIVIWDISSRVPVPRVARTVLLVTRVHRSAKLPSRVLALRVPFLLPRRAVVQIAPRASTKPCLSSRPAHYVPRARTARSQGFQLFQARV